MDNLLKLIFPPKCIVCENYGSLLCENCLKKCRKLRRHYELQLPPPHPSLDVFYYFVYEQTIRECIRHAKYLKKQFAVLREISKIAVSDMLSRDVSFSADYVVPIPLSLKKKRYRGFNQAKVISNVISKAYLIPHQNSILTRQKNTRSQHRLNKKERMKNIKGAFKVSFDISGKKILLVDDICTTGATLTESARVLYNAGAAKVSAFTLSKMLKNQSSFS